MNDNIMCRICLRKGKFASIFRTRGLESISCKIMLVANISIEPDDGLPSSICTKCIKNLDITDQFIKLCKLSDSKMRANNTINNNTNFKSSSSTFDSEDFCIISNGSTILETSKIIESSKSQEQDIFVEKKRFPKPQCFVCGRIMSSKLKWHLKTHTGERSFTCDICDKKFVLKQNLQLHLRTHTGEKPFDCPVCGVKFSHPSSLVVHKRNHTGHTPYKCKVCPSEFRSISALQYHTKKHTGEKNYECGTCKKAFMRRSDVNKHVKIHNGDRPNLCSTCGAGFKRTTHLKEHMYRVHGVLKLNPKDKTTVIKKTKVKKSKENKIDECSQTSRPVPEEIIKSEQK